MIIEYLEKLLPTNWNKMDIESRRMYMNFESVIVSKDFPEGSREFVDVVGVQ